MAGQTAENRGNWSSKLGFILAAAGSAVGLGNIWRFPGEVADNGGAVFLIVYLVSCFLVGFPIMVAELTIGRKTGKNPVGAFKSLHKSKFFPLIGFWGVLCGFMILSFYNVVAGWTFSFVFEEIAHFFEWSEAQSFFSTLDIGWKNAVFCVLFMAFTITIINAGVSEGIERATKIMMPVLIIILFVLIGYVLTLPGAMEGVAHYLKPDFSKMNMKVILNAMGQSFFSLSLGMGAMITYGSYLSKKDNIASSAAFVTLADIGIAFIAGLLIVPAMFVAKAQGITIFSGDALASGGDLVFKVLPSLFHEMAPITGLILGGSFFLLLSIAALTSTISLLEVPVSFIIDEYGWRRKKASLVLGSGVLLISLFISFDISLIGNIDLVFSVIGLPLGGLLISVFLAYFWKTDNALEEIKQGFDGNFTRSLFYKSWPFLIKFVSPIIIGLVFLKTLYDIFFN